MSGSVSPPSRRYPGCLNSLWYQPAASMIYLSILILIVIACGKEKVRQVLLMRFLSRLQSHRESTHTSVDETISLTASVQDQNGEVINEAIVSWRSRDESVAKVNPKGLVQTVGYGNAVITATSGQVQGNASVTVSNPARAVLLALYDATDGENWTNSTNWSTDEPVSEWHGVFSDVAIRGVALQSSSNTGLERLDLSDNQLAGEIPSALGNLSELRYLDLSENTLTGEIPAALGMLTKLDTLKLNDNLLSGRIPTELGNLRNLQELSLHDNSDLTGPLPQSFTNLDSLGTLSLSGTLLCAPTDSTFQNWLEGIENKSGIVNCGDDTVLDRNVLIALYNATNGINWKTSSNWLTDESLESWYGIGVNTEGRVDSLVLEDNDLNGTIPTSLGNLAELLVLDLSDNELSGVIPSELGNLDSLVTLDLSNNELSGEIPYAVIGLPSLQNLDLSGNQFASLPSEREALIAFYNATGGPDWYISTNWLSDEPIASWHGIITNADGNTVTGFDLDFNNLTGGLPPELGHFANLSTLDLDYNNLSGELPTELGSLVSLTSLDLSDNEFTGEIPPELGQLTKLESLDLSGNDLSGQLPPEMTQLVNLTQLYLQATSVCVPPTEAFHSWINGIGLKRLTYCVSGTPGNEPVDQAAFEALVSGKVLSIESYYLEFDSGRFNEIGEYQGDYTYAVEDTSSGTGVLTLRYDEGVSIDSCKVELLFVQPTKGNTRYRCDEGLFLDFEQWKLTDAPDPDTFDIEIVWVGEELGGAYRMAFESAVERWERVITSDLTNQYLYWSDLPTDADDIDDLFENGSEERIFGYIDDLTLYVQMESIDGEEGLLGFAGPVYTRTPSHLPLLSAMVLDSDDLDDFTTVAFQDLVLHEMAHALGFGTIWEDLDLLKNPSVDFFGDPITPSPDTHFSGTNAITAFNGVGGGDYTGAKVPVENSEGGAGTRDSHWRDSVIGPNELMDGFGDPTQTELDPLSLITIQSMADLGYIVDVTQADSYTLPTDDESSMIAIRSRSQIPLNCFSGQRFRARVIERHKSIVPLFERRIRPTK